MESGSSIMFRGSITIATVASIPVRLHWTFAVLLGWLFVGGAVHGGTVAAGIASATFSLGVFACVALHELGHALAAKRFGIRTRDITLFALGGVATLERMPDRPWQGITVALAGPMVNVVIAAALFTGLVRQDGLQAMLTVDRPAARIEHGLAALAGVNLWLVLFNMLPAFPMDGGRVLREALTMGVGTIRATRIAAGIGQAMAVGMAFLGVFTSPMLLLIALYVWLAAAAEVIEVEGRVALAGLPVSATMERRFVVFAPGQLLIEAARELLAGSQRDFPVTATGDPGDRVVGVLTRDDLVRTLARDGAGARVDHAMRVDVPTIGEGDPAEAAVAAMRANRCRSLPVLRQDRLVGIVTADGIAEFMSLHATGVDLHPCSPRQENGEDSA